MIDKLKQRAIDLECDTDGKSEDAKLMRQVVQVYENIQVRLINLKTTLNGEKRDYSVLRGMIIGEMDGLNWVLERLRGENE